MKKLKKSFEDLRTFVRKNSQPITTVAAVGGCTLAMGVALTKTAGLVIIVGGVLVSGYYGAKLAVEMVDTVKGE